MTTMPVISPVTNDVIKEINFDTKETLAKKIESAHVAQKNFSKIDYKKRSQIFYDYRQLIKENYSQLAKLIHLENGKTLDEANAEVAKVIEQIEFACAIPQFLSDEISQVSQGIYCKNLRRPLGVVASITPFNFPLMIPHWTTPIALMCGNAVLLKPSEKTPLSALKMKELLEKTDLPADLFHVVLGEKNIVDTLCQHEKISALSFVGSTAVAKSVYKNACLNEKRALCLGGAKNHLVVMPDADETMAAKDIVASAFGMAGQRCMAASIMLALSGCDHIIERVKSEAQNLIPKTNLAAIISQESKERIIKAIDHAEKNGAKIILDGRTHDALKNLPGNYLGPTIIDHVQPGSSAACDEIFGPVLSIIRCNNLREAVTIQNQNFYGNGASIYTKDGGTAQFMSEHLQAGMIGINIGVPVPREPFSFGGIKQSKFGALDITGKSSINFWTDLIKVTSKWNENDRDGWMS